MPKINRLLTASGPSLAMPAGSAQGRLSEPVSSQPSLPGIPLAPVLASGNSIATQPWTTVLDGQRLRQLRRQRGLSQEGLAERAGISLTTIARLERQPRASCRCRTLGRLAAALGEQPTTIAHHEPDHRAAGLSRSASAPCPAGPNPIPQARPARGRDE